MAAATQKTWFPRRLHLFVVGGDVISSSRDKLMVGAFGHAVPRAHQRLELRDHIPLSPRDELMVGTLGDVVPWAYQCLEFRERRVDLPRHLAFLGFLSHDLGGELLELAQHRR